MMAQTAIPAQAGAEVHHLNIALRSKAGGALKGEAVASRVTMRH